MFISRVGDGCWPNATLCYQTQHIKRWIVSVTNYILLGYFLCRPKYFMFEYQNVSWYIIIDSHHVPHASKNWEVDFFWQLKKLSWSLSSLHCRHKRYLCYSSYLSTTYLVELAKVTQHWNILNSMRMDYSVYKMTRICMICQPSSGFLGDVDIKYMNSVI